MAVLDVTDAKLFSETIDRPTNEKKRKQHSEKKIQQRTNYSSLI